MSIEYRFTITTPQGISMPELRTALQQGGHYDLLNVDGNKLQLAYTGRRRRRLDWPEDIVIEIADAGIHVAVNSGTRQQRTSFVEDVAEILRQHGVIFEVGEI